MDNIRFQAEKHGIVSTEGFSSFEEKNLFLIHLKSYYEAKRFVKGKKVLDLGCNNGYGTKMISPLCSYIAGADVSPKAIKEGQRKYGQDRIDFVLVDGISLPFDNKSFDVVLSFQVIEHVSDYDTFLNEIKRVLPSDGMVVFTTPNALIRLDVGMKPWNPFHVQEFNDRELKELLQSYFPKVIIQGLFAKEPLYSFELNRNKRYLAKARLDTKRIDTYRSLIRSILPEAVVNTIRSILRLMRNKKINRPNIHLIQPLIIGQYSTSDFFYRDDNFNQALHFMAICSFKQLLL